MSLMLVPPGWYALCKRCHKIVQKRFKSGYCEAYNNMKCFICRERYTSIEWYPIRDVLKSMRKLRDKGGAAK